MLKRWWEQRFVSIIKTNNKAGYCFAYGAACSRSNAEKIIQRFLVRNGNAGNIDTLRPMIRTSVFKLEK